MCDVNSDGVCGVEDAILALQVLVNVPAPEDVLTGVDVNKDGKIGLEDVVYILQYLSELRYQ